MSLSPTEKMRLLADASVVGVSGDKLEPYVMRVLDEVFDGDSESSDVQTNANGRLRVTDFVRGKGVDPTRMKAVRFGTLVKTAYMVVYGHEPEKDDKGANVYTEADRPLMESAWESYWKES